jgi:hypothetical protein
MDDTGHVLLELILPPQGRLVLMTGEHAGRLGPGPGLVVALEHKGPTGSQSLAGLLDQQLARTLRDALDMWLRIAERGDVEARPDAGERLSIDLGTVRD